VFSSSIPGGSASHSRLLVIFHDIFGEPDVKGDRESTRANQHDDVVQAEQQAMSEVALAVERLVHQHGQFNG
jgi:hypothetical protein